MRDITRDEIRQAFGEKTFSRGLEYFENGVDDSDGTLGGFVIECVNDFKVNVEKLGEEQKRALIYKIMDIIEVEDYGLDI